MVVVDDVVVLSFTCHIDSLDTFPGLGRNEALVRSQATGTKQPKVIF